MVWKIFPSLVLELVFYNTDLLLLELSMLSSDGYKYHVYHKYIMTHSS